MILITGKTGFIGNNLSIYLENHKYGIIESLGRDTIPNWDTIESIDKYQTIIHLSGLAHDINKVYTEKDYNYANYDLTKKLYDLFLSAKNSKTFIFISTIAVRDKHSGIFSENDNVNPVSYYGKSKRLAEEYILNNLPKDKNIYIIRPCMVHGQGDKGNLTLLYKFIKKEIPYPLGSFDNKRSFLSIDNLCFIIKELIERNDIPSGIYHLSDDEPMDTKNLIKLINKITNKKTLIWKLPKFFIKIIGKIGDIIPLPINTERIEKLTESYIVSNQKIKKALGKDFPISTQDGLIKTIKSFKK